MFTLFIAVPLAPPLRKDARQKQHTDDRLSFRLTKRPGRNTMNLHALTGVVSPVSGFARLASRDPAHTPALTGGDLPLIRMPSPIPHFQRPSRFFSQGRDSTAIGIFRHALYVTNGGIKPLGLAQQWEERFAWF